MLFDSFSPGENLQPTCTTPVPQKDLQYWRVLVQCWHQHGLPPTLLQKLTWLEVVHRYWRSTEHRYHTSTEICTGSVVALLRSRLLADTWSQDWGCTMPVLRQPLPRYQLSSTGIAPCLELAQYCITLINYRGGNLQPAWYCASTAERFAALVRHWHSGGISTAYHWCGSER